MQESYASARWLLVALCTAMVPATTAVAWVDTPEPYVGPAPMCSVDAPLSVVVDPVWPSDWEAEPTMCPPPPLGASYGGAEGELDDETARAALARARDLADKGRPEEALLHVGVVMSAFPRLADRFELMRGDLLIAAERPRDACKAYEAAMESLDDAVRVLGRVGTVRCLITAGDPRADNELNQLLRLYPELPQYVQLRFELAQSHERFGRPRSAAHIYRRIDEFFPGSAMAEHARERLEELEGEGVPVWPLPAAQRIERAGRLVRSGPVYQAKRTISALLGEPGLGGELRARVALMAARIARVEGRWDDARQYLAEARVGRKLPEDVTRATLIAQAADLAPAAEARERAQAEVRIRQLTGRRPYRALPFARLVHVIRIGAPAGLREPVDAALEALLAKRAPPQVLLRAALHAAGAASDERLAEALEGLRDHPRIGLKARYHHARALERLGRWQEAETSHIEIVERDAGGFYGMWSEQRLWAVREAMVGSCGPGPLASDAPEPLEAPANEPSSPATAPSDAPATKTTGETDGDKDGDKDAPEAITRGAHDGPVPGSELIHRGTDPTPGPRVAALSPEAAVAATADNERSYLEARPPVGLGPNRPTRTRHRATDAQLVERLAPVAEAWGDALPWLPRALDLLKLGERDAAADEIHEAYLAWRRARGRPIRYVGLESVYRGTERRRRGTTWMALQRRRKLDPDALEVLASVAEDLGEDGVALGFQPIKVRIANRPRAYEEIVQRAAEKYSLDPNLLFAVMRVESVYQKRIISYAGAVGLMQIMPRTGALIADKLGREDFTTADLLDPETNVEFAAWYLSSLIERFDGRLPLAIASYNGGPHNVRRWLRNHPSDMPLDTFLEHIPFTQTHRYVRRVLTHYAAYRRQQGLPMERLTVRLPPEPTPDPIGF